MSLREDKFRFKANRKALHDHFQTMAGGNTVYTVVGPHHRSKVQLRLRLQHPPDESFVSAHMGFIP